jgi:protoporphyrin/coproporphyrin ferrochelatase
LNYNFRAPKSSEAYRSIGGGSPIVNYTNAQAQLIQQSLRDRGFDNTKCYFAMRYWHPFTEDVLQQMQKDGINTMVIVPLYPQFSISTSGSSLRLLQDIFYKAPQLWGPDKIAHTVVPAWYHRPGYVRVVARQVLDKIAEYSAEEMLEGIHVLFSAHGVPQYYIEAGDPYQRQIEECIKLIRREVRSQLLNDKTRPTNISKKVAQELAGQLVVSARTQEMINKVNEMFGTGGVPPVEFHLSFQSRVGPVKWLTPYTEDILIELGEEKKVRNLVVVPISFVSEHIETLEEIDMEYQVNIA